jgi:hypothetical protein
VRDANSRAQVRPLLRINHERFDLLGPVGPRCADMEAFGQASRSGDLQGKRACGLSWARPPCTVLSIGSNNQWGFERAVVARTECRVVTFDCTLGPSVGVPADLTSRVALRRVCMTGNDAEAARAALKPATLYQRRNHQNIYVAAPAPMEFRSYAEIAANETGGVPPGQPPLLPVPSRRTSCASRVARIHVAMPGVY